MSLTLYRKYRPQTFAELVGQNHIKTTLQNEIETNQVAQAYLFTGPRGTGKTTTARLVAKAVNCLNRQVGKSEPCNQCEACKEIAESRALDVLEIDAASHTGVDNVRENIINNSRFVPSQRKFKVFIIDEVHMLSLSAFNALLKTLEEPPAHVIFILATTEPHKLPPTIISRCQRFDFHKVSLAELIERLNWIINVEEKKVEPAVVEQVARQAEGCVRDAESLLAQVLSLGEKEVTLELAQLVIPYSDFNLVLELIEYLAKKQGPAGIDLINRLADEGIDLKVFNQDLIEVLRKILLIKVGANLANYSFDLVKDQEERLMTLAERLKLAEVLAMMENFILKQQELKFAKIAQLPLEMAVVEICEEVGGTDRTNKSDRSDGTEKGEPLPRRDSPRLRSGPSAGALLGAARGFKKGEGGEEISNSPNCLISNIMPEADPPLAGNPNAKIQSSKDAWSFDQVRGRSEGTEKTVVRCTLDFVKEKWSEVLLKIKEYNTTLFSFLRVNQPVAVKDNVIQIGVCYKFHQERISELKNRQILEQVLAEILGQPVRVECVLVKSVVGEPAFVKEDKSIQNLLEEFGGRVVG